MENIFLLCCCKMFFYTNLNLQSTFTYFASIKKRKWKCVNNIYFFTISLPTITLRLLHNIYRALNPSSHFAHSHSVKIHTRWLVPTSLGCVQIQPCCVELLAHLYLATKWGACIGSKHCTRPPIFWNCCASLCSKDLLPSQYSHSVYIVKLAARKAVIANISTIIVNIEHTTRLHVRMHKHTHILQHNEYLELVISASFNFSSNTFQNYNYMLISKIK